MYNMIRGFHEAGTKVSLLCFNTIKHFVTEEELPPIFNSLEYFRTVNIDTKVTPRGILKNLFSKDSLHVSRFKNAEFTKLLKTLVLSSNYDVVQIEGIKMAQYAIYIRDYSKVKIGYRAHNVEYMIWERLASHEWNFARRVYLKLLSKKLRKFELRIAKYINAVIPITSKDKENLLEMGFKLPMHVSPTGLDIEKYVPDKSHIEWGIYHLGSLDWMPNQQSLIWFLERVWPRIIEKEPAIKFNIAGRNIPDYIYKYGSENIKILGEITNAMEFTNQNGIMIVPLLSGSGMRIKIIEAMALGKPIVSTSIGAEGIECTHGKDIMIADGAEEFVNAVIRCYCDRNMAEKIGENAREMVIEFYDNKKIIHSLLNFYATQNLLPIPKSKLIQAML